MDRRKFDEALIFAKKAHSDTRHTYDGQDYYVHLRRVYRWALDFEELLEPQQRVIAFQACWLHDTIEDTRKTYNDIREPFGVEVAEVVYALTNEKGRNRKERANDKYYAGIRENPIAHFVKICDRLANVDYSLKHDHKDKVRMYATEFPEFYQHLKSEKFAPMLMHLHKLLKPHMNYEI